MVARQPACLSAAPAGLPQIGAGNVYFGSSICGTVRKVDPSGVLSTYAGNGSPGFKETPWAITMDNSGNMYACDDGVGGRAYKVAPDGAITIIAGNGTSGFSGDGGPATSASLFEPQGIAVDAAGNVYIADYGNRRVRRVDPSGIITTVAGGGTANPVDGGPPTGVLVIPEDVAVDSSGNLYIAAGVDLQGFRPFQRAAQRRPAPVISGVVSGASFQPGVVGEFVGHDQGNKSGGADGRLEPFDRQRSVAHLARRREREHRRETGVRLLHLTGSTQRAGARCSCRADHRDRDHCRWHKCDLLYHGQRVRPCLLRLAR